MNCPQCNRPLVHLMSDCLFCSSGYPDQSVTASENLQIECEALKAEVAQQFPETDFDIRLGREQVRIPEMLTYRNIGISGADGTGKTQVVKSLLQQLRAMANQKCLIVDINGYFYSRFGQPGDKVLSLDHQQSEAWNLWNEEVTPEFLAEALIVEPNQSHRFFSAASQALVADLLKLNNTAEGLWRDLTSSPNQLIERVKGGSSPAFLGQPDQVAGVQAMAVSQMNFFQQLNFRNQEREPFSLTQWATSPSNEWVFLIVNAHDLVEFSPLLRLWFELAIRGVLQRDASSDNPHLWLIADRLPALVKLPSLQKLLVQTRRYKASVVAGYQVSSQLQNIYGRAAAKAIIHNLQNKICFRSPDPIAAMELGLPERELQNLADLQAYLEIYSFAPTRIHMDDLSPHA